MALDDKTKSVFKDKLRRPWTPPLYKVKWIMKVFRTKNCENATTRQCDKIVRILKRNILIFNVSKFSIQVKSTLQLISSSFGYLIVIILYFNILFLSSFRWKMPARLNLDCVTLKINWTNRITLFTLVFKSFVNVNKLAFVTTKSEFFLKKWNC